MALLKWIDKLIFGDGASMADKAFNTGFQAGRREAYEEGRRDGFKAGMRHAKALTNDKVPHEKISEE